MSLPLLVNGADCGPVNPLQGLSKRFDQDRGIQQDHFGAGRAGPSRESFRSQYSAAADVSQDAARFFSSHSAPPLANGSAPFDLNALHASLPTSHSQSLAALTPQRHIPIQSSSAAWAVDFLSQPSKQQTLPVHGASASTQIQPTQSSSTHSPQQFSPNGLAPNLRGWTPMSMGYNAAGFMGVAGPAFHTPVQTPGAALSSDASQWDREFESQVASLNPGESVAQPLEQIQQDQTQSRIHDADELARTAGRLMETVREEPNPKFKNSQFLGLMRQLRDGEVVVEGDKMVSRESARSDSAAVGWTNDSQGTTDVKGKGRALPTSPLSGISNETTASYRPQAAIPMTRDGQIFNETNAVIDGFTENPIDAYLRSENEDYIELQRVFHSVSEASNKGNVAVHGQDADWGRLQSDWDVYEATATGVRPLAHYRFQAHNPYVLGEASRTDDVSRTSIRTALFENVLELEAAVQRDPTNALRWYELGVKQQENEREQKAVQALRRALELDPSHLSSWLALAISHTNEANRQGVYEAVREWVDRNERYHSAVQQFRALNPITDDMVPLERLENLTQCLIHMARSAAGTEIDADIQIALAVLLNTAEDYQRARDCFNTALAVRPEDWLLYNRVGATLANSGHPEEALQYYHRALELNPTYIRARFNLGISCINLRRYEEAAQNILDALLLQDSDSVADQSGAGEKRGVTSSALWQSLKTCCMHMQRIDLTTLCDREDLEAFRLNFHLG
ncbi:uncharacterized protein FIBRA_02292 [Fibroporia radiculosa]|uniref:Uncharacterized protein n=1 Tax=Fibroporia radiculosa TaxID=599839 RepID=J4HUN9_9APHY|nr:uncharacterized protein FIBRA_02292 [Fibroporia radiculosa]CCM00262.1 predicted protein [Fibroporia radiculosa]